MEKLPEKGILLAFGELFLKSATVKTIFEKRLIENIFFFLKKAGLDFKIYPFRDRIFIKSGESAKAAKAIKRIFGISWFSECLFFEKTGPREFSRFLTENYPKWIKEKETFALRLKMEKDFFKESRDKMIDMLAENIDRKVDLNNPKREIFIEAKRNGWFLYFKKNKGSGGLPFSTAGRVLSLVSGGIDSPVSSFSILKRGAENVWLHFHSFPLVSNVSIEKVKDLAKVFLNYQPHLKVYFLPFGKTQMEVKAKIPEKYRILVYRRLMLKIAEIIAKKENCLGLVTGESLGQVSSQTLPNMNITEEAVKIPVLRPLISSDKEEIIEIAKEIGTFSISIKPQEDCCTLFTPKHPTAQGRIEEIKKMEKELDIKKIIKSVIKEAVIERY